MGHVVGIDLGTTNSVIAVLEAGAPTVLTNAEGARTTPSVVAFAKTGEVLVGDVAKRQAITNPSRTFRSIKSKIGSGWRSDDIDGRSYTPQEISARTLMKLKRDAEAHLAGPVTQAVITVPAYFDDAQRTATRHAGQIAGLDVLRIVNEPTAAALAYGLDKLTDDQTILVFDLGGGTLDVSVLTITDGVFDVKATSGDTHLGGDDWDQRIVDWMTADFAAGHGIDLATDRMAVQRLHETAERAKIELSQVAHTQLNVPFVTATVDGPLHIDMTLTRATFDELTRDLIERCRTPLQAALADAGIHASDLDRVLLVGGVTRIPAVGALVRELTGTEPERGINPDEAVAAGAAIQGGVLRGEVTDVLLLDVTPLSLGIETRGGVMTTLVTRNTTIPHVRTEMFTTAVDDQPAVDIHVLQGESPIAAENTTLGRFSLVDLAPAPRGVPQIDVTFDIDADGIVHVSARDRASGQLHTITVTGHAALADAELAEMAAAAERDAARERADVALAAARNDADTLAYRAGAFLGSSPALAAGELAHLNALLSRLNSERGCEDIDAIVAAHRALCAALDTATATLTAVAGDDPQDPADGDDDRTGATAVAPSPGPPRRQPLFDPSAHADDDLPPAAARPDDGEDAHDVRDDTVDDDVEFGEPDVDDQFGTPATGFDDGDGDEFGTGGLDEFGGDGFDDGDDGFAF